MAMMEADSKAPRPHLRSKKCPAPGMIFASDFCTELATKSIQGVVIPARIGARFRSALKNGTFLFKEDVALSIFLDLFQLPVNFFHSISSITIVLRTNYHKVLESGGTLQNKSTVGNGPLCLRRHDNANDADRLRLVRV